MVHDRKVEHTACVEVTLGRYHLRLREVEVHKENCGGWLGLVATLARAAQDQVTWAELRITAGHWPFSVHI